MNTHTIVSGVQNDIMNTPVVPDSHRNASKRPEDSHGQGRVVSAIRILPVVE